MAIEPGSIVREKRKRCSASATANCANPWLKPDAAMTAKSLVVSYCAALLVWGGNGTHASAASTTVDSAKAQITVLYDAFGQTSAMQKDWGYAALVEYAGKRILFDTGNNPDILEKNAQAKGIDLAKLDFVVMSHRHGDHMGGLSYILRMNLRVTIYAPKEGFGVYGVDLLSI